MNNIRKEGFPQSKHNLLKIASVFAKKLYTLTRNLPAFQILILSGTCCNLISRASTSYEVRLALIFPCRKQKERFMPQTRKERFTNGHVSYRYNSWNISPRTKLYRIIAILKMKAGYKELRQRLDIIVPTRPKYLHE